PEVRRRICRAHESFLLRMLQRWLADVDDLDAELRLLRLQEQIGTGREEAPEHIAREDEPALTVAHPDVEEIRAHHQRFAIGRRHRLERLRDVDAERVTRLEEDVAAGLE